MNTAPTREEKLASFQQLTKLPGIKTAPTCGRIIEQGSHPDRSPPLVLGLDHGM